MLAFGLAKTARSEVGPLPVALTWNAPPGCPTVDQVAADVNRMVSKVAAPGSPFTAAAQVVPGPGATWQGRLDLDIRGAHAERRLEAESCEVLAAQTAVIIAVALDEAGDESAVVAAPEAVVRSTAPAPVRAPASSFLGANAVIDDGTMPSPPGAGLEVAVGHEWVLGPLRPALTLGTTWLHSLQPAVNNLLGPVTGSFWSLGLSGRACLSVAAFNVEIGPCVGGELIAMHGSNSGYADVSLVTDTHDLFSYLGSLAASYRVVPSLQVVLRADYVIPTSHPTFAINNDVLPAFVVPGAAFRTAFGVAYLFR